jgi:hypothetical protein
MANSGVASLQITADIKSLSLDIDPNCVINFNHSEKLGPI